MANKNLFITYVLWLFFGWFGLHHFYLGRDRHAFIWWSTFGGFFFLGWFRDLWRIPEYVDDANSEKWFIEDLLNKMKLRNGPPFNISRFAGELMVGYFYGLIVRLAIPYEMPSWFMGFFVCLGITLGVHLVGNIGREKGQFFFPFLSCGLCYIGLSYITGEEANYMYCALATSCIFNYYREYERTVRQPRGTCSRLTTLTVGAFVIISLWGSFLYFNAEITLESGEKIKIKDSVDHFFKSPAWLEFKSTCWQLYEHAQKQGWRNVYDEFVKSLDPQGETNALKVLGLPEDASQTDIRKKYKKLAVKWHPDRNQDNREEAEKNFIEVQQAYETLSKIKSKKSSQQRSEPDRTEF